MNKTPPLPDSLELAFLRFEEAASSLENHHSTLQAKVEVLERQLLDSNRQLEAVLDALASGVAVVSSQGQLLRANQAFERMKLVGRERNIGQGLLGELGDLHANHGGTARLRVDGGQGSRDLAVTRLPVGDAQGNQVLTVQDITAIRREEEEGGRRMRLEALGRMAAELAHEVRNPLGSIRLFASMLLEDLKDDEEQRSMAEQILGASAGLESTVVNLLSFAAPSAGQFQTVDLARLAREACSLLAPASAIRGVRLEGPRDGLSCPLDADPEGLRQVILNLIGNALAATREGGYVRVEALAENGRAVLQVSDDGCGISAEDLPRVFDPFFTRTEGGTGLGLSIVHGILERHRGQISLDSRSGAGTCARVELPLGPTDPESNEAPHA